jgi:hypothetical protein
MAKNPGSDPEITAVDAARVTRPLSRQIKVAFADAVASFADMEAAIETVIWGHTGLETRHGRLLTGMDVRRKIEIAKALLAERMPPKDFKESTAHIWTELEHLRVSRNNLVHGTLFMLDHTRLLAVSFRGKGGDMFAGAIFSVAGLRQIAVSCEHLKQWFQELADAYERLRSTSVAPPHPT